jgi:hypothetical protein
MFTGFCCPCLSFGVALHPSLKRILERIPMARIIERLTAVLIRQTKKCGLHSDGGGLNLKVTKTGSKSFVFRYSIQGDEKRIGLGSESPLIS